MEEMATHSSLLARKIPCTEEPGGRKRVGYNLVTENVRSAWEPLIPQPGIESMTLQWKHGVLTTGLPGKSLNNIFPRAF